MKKLINESFTRMLNTWLNPQLKLIKALELRRKALQLSSPKSTSECRNFRLLRLPEKLSQTSAITEKFSH